MKKLITILALTAITFSAQSQIIVNGNDISNESIIEIWAFKKPLSSKEVFFANYGQEKFRPYYYDHKSQRIDGVGKSASIKLLKLMRDNGFTKIDEREEYIGNAKGRVLTFEKE